MAELRDEEAVRQEKGASVMDQAGGDDRSKSRGNIGCRLFRSDMPNTQWLPWLNFPSPSSVQWQHLSSVEEVLLADQNTPDEPPVPTVSLVDSSRGRVSGEDSADRLFEGLFDYVDD